MLATDDQNLMAARMSIFLLALDKPVREKMSELLISMVEQKLSKEEFDALMTYMDEFSAVIPSMYEDMEKLTNERISEADFPKTAKKAKKLEKKVK